MKMQHEGEGDRGRERGKERGPICRKVGETERENVRRKKRETES